MTITAEQAAKLLDGATPGPWKVFYTTNGQTIIGIGDADGGGVTDPHFGLWRSGKEQKANARLIAAAPDLAAALIASEAARKLAEERLAALIRRAHDAIIRDENDGAVWAQLLADMAREIDNG